jgi:hypothetical protein
MMLLQPQPAYGPYGPRGSTGPPPPPPPNIPPGPKMPIRNLPLEGELSQRLAPLTSRLISPSMHLRCQKCTVNKKATIP